MVADLLFSTPALSTWLSETSLALQEQLTGKFPDLTTIGLAFPVLSLPANEGPKGKNGAASSP